MHIRNKFNELRDAIQVSHRVGRPATHGSKEIGQAAEIAAIRIQVDASTLSLCISA